MEESWTSFKACPQEKMGFDLVNNVCLDQGLDQACLRHDYGAYSRRVGNFAVVNEYFTAKATCGIWCHREWSIGVNSGLATVTIGF